MKRLGSSDSLGAIMTICPSTAEEQSPSNNHHVYGRDPFQSMLMEGLEEEGCVEEAGQHSEKKRRLRVDQVKALEKNFEVENKLEPERKVKLAQELGLQPRQVAVWFQNRRARWKTKQLERDYGVLKANYEALKVNYDALKQDNEALHKEIMELKSRLQEDQNTASGVSVIKEEIITTMPEESEHEKANNEEHSDDPSPESESNDDDHLNYDNCFIVKDSSAPPSSSSLFLSDFKDGASDSDTSAILNEDNNNSPKAAISSSNNNNNNNNNNGVVIQNQTQFNCSFTSSTSTMNCFQFQKPFQTQYVKMEEHNFFTADEPCNFFSDEQAPSLHWYCSDQWG